MPRSRTTVTGFTTHWLTLILSFGDGSRRSYDAGPNPVVPSCRRWAPGVDVDDTAFKPRDNCGNVVKSSAAGLYSFRKLDHLISDIGRTARFWNEGYSKGQRWAKCLSECFMLSRGPNLRYTSDSGSFSGLAAVILEVLQERKTLKQNTADLPPSVGLVVLLLYFFVPSLPGRFW